MFKYAILYYIYIIFQIFWQSLPKMIKFHTYKKGNGYWKIPFELIYQIDKEFICDDKKTNP